MNSSSRVVDDGVGAERLDQLQIRVLHTPVTRAPRLPVELHRGRADGPRGAVDQHVLPGRDPGPADEDIAIRPPYGRAAASAS